MSQDEHEKDQYEVAYLLGDKAQEYVNATFSEPEEEFVEPLLEEEESFEEIIVEPEPLINPYGGSSVIIEARDGTIWDGTMTISIGTTTYNADAREVHVVEPAPVLTPNSEILDILQVGETFNALGWTRGLEYKGERRYWVDTFNNRIPVRSTSEKPV